MGGELDIEIRRATTDDARAIGEVFDAAVRAEWTYLGELAEEPMLAPEDRDRLVADHAPPNVLLVATDHAGRVLGYAAAHPEDGELFLLFVHPAYGRRGIGRALLGAAHDALRAAGCREAFLFTHERNERALAVYASAGYRPDGTVRESDFRDGPRADRRSLGERAPGRPRRRQHDVAAADQRARRRLGRRARARGALDPRRGAALRRSCSCGDPGLTATERF